MQPGPSARILRHRRFHDAPWKLTITFKPPTWRKPRPRARTLMALLSDNQLLIQKTQPDAPMPERFTKDSVILDKVP